METETNGGLMKGLSILLEPYIPAIRQGLRDHAGAAVVTGTSTFLGAIVGERYGMLIGSIIGVAVSYFFGAQIRSAGAAALTALTDSQLLKLIVLGIIAGLGALGILVARALRPLVGSVRNMLGPNSRYLA